MNGTKGYDDGTQEIPAGCSRRHRSLSCLARQDKRDQRRVAGLLDGERNGSGDSSILRRSGRGPERVHKGADGRRQDVPCRVVRKDDIRPPSDGQVEVRRLARPERRDPHADGRQSVESESSVPAEAEPRLRRGGERLYERTAAERPELQADGRDGELERVRVLLRIHPRQSHEEGRQEDLPGEREPHRVLGILQRPRAAAGRHARNGAHAGRQADESCGRG